MKRRTRSARHAQVSVAQEAARIMAQDGAASLQQARMKAAERLGVRNHKHLPELTAVQEALQDYQRLFFPAKHAVQLRALREKALEAMRALQRFEPRLAGAVLDGSAGPSSPIQIHVFADTPEEVAQALLEMHIPWEQQERTLRCGDGTPRAHPIFRFIAGGTAIELFLLPLQGLRSAPLDPSDGKPMRRVSLAGLQTLLAEDKGSTLI